MTRAEKRSFKKKIEKVAKMVEDAKRKQISHVVTTVRETVPCWESMTELDKEDE